MHIDPQNINKEKRFILVGAGNMPLSKIMGAMNSIDQTSIEINGMKLIDQGNNIWVEVDPMTYNFPTPEKLKEIIANGKMPNFTDIIKMRQIADIKQSGKIKRKDRRIKERKQNKNKSRRHGSHDIFKDET